MPQVDLETLVSACAGGGNNDRKITCETLAENTSKKPVKDDMVEEQKEEEVPPDFPPESFWLSRDAEFDWVDRNAFLERKQSTKGIGPNTPSLNLNSHMTSNSNSQRFSKASILGLPKAQKNNFVVDSKRRTCKATNIRLFPTKRSESAIKATVTEPTSPKVSCMGRVRSKRSRRQKSTINSQKIERHIERARSNGDRKQKQKTGFYSKLVSIFRSGKNKKKPVRSSTEKTLGSEPVVMKPLRKSKSVSAARDVHVVVEPVSEPAGLGGMKRFRSGRRSESWGADEINAVI